MGNWGLLNRYSMVLGPTLKPACTEGGGEFDTRVRGELLVRVDAELSFPPSQTFIEIIYTFRGKNRYVFLALTTQ